MMYLHYLIQANLYLLVRDSTKTMIDSNKIDHHVEKALQSETAGRMHKLLQSRLGLWAIAAISFFESALPVPIITDPFMVAGIMANRGKAALIVGITIVSSIVGGLAAFAMAAFFFDFIAATMTTDMQNEFQRLVSFGASDTLVTTFTGAITPVPYTITAWVIAVAGGSIFLFIIASIIGRTVRYSIVGYCTYRFGPAALQYARRSLTVTSIVVLVLVGVYVWLKL